MTKLEVLATLATSGALVCQCLLDSFPVHAPLCKLSELFGSCLAKRQALQLHRAHGNICQHLPSWGERAQCASALCIPMPKLIKYLLKLRFESDHATRNITLVRAMCSPRFGYSETESNDSVQVRLSLSNRSTLHPMDCRVNYHFANYNIIARTLQLSQCEHPSAYQAVRLFMSTHLNPSYKKYLPLRN